MAISVTKNKNVPVKEKSLEQQVKDQQAQIAQLESDKLELQIMAAEIFEQGQMDKLELQTALAELAESIAILFE